MSWVPEDVGKMLVLYWVQAATQCLKAIPGSKEGPWPCKSVKGVAVTWDSEE